MILTFCNRPMLHTVYMYCQFDAQCAKARTTNQKNVWCHIAVKFATTFDRHLTDHTVATGKFEG